MSNFCFHPWVGLDIDPQGNFKPCCKYKNTISDNLNEYFSSSHLNDLKQQFLSGIKPEGCKRCWNDEEAGLPSKRILDKTYKLVDENNLSTIQVLSLPFGNTCNLACRTCNSFSSSRWATEEQKLKDRFPGIQIHNHKKFYKDANFIEKIKTLSSNIIDIQFPGGESFITGIEEQLNYLDYLIENNSKNITLTYITNTTTFPDNRFWDRWKSFKHVIIQLSIDGIKEKFEYLRWPAVWDTCYQNIKKYQSKQKQSTNIQLSISHTVSIFNILYLNDFFKWCMSEQLPEPYIGMVNHPMHYNVKNFPDCVKKEIAKTLGTLGFNSVVDYLMQDHTQDFIQSMEWISALDNQRNQQFSSVFPEMAKILEANKY